MLYYFIALDLSSTITIFSDITYSGAVYGWLRIVSAIPNVSRIYFLFIYSRVGRSFDLRSLLPSISFRIRFIAASITLPDSLASILIIDRCTNLSRCKSIGTVLVSTSNTSVAVALYAPIATLRAFPYIDLILLVTPLRAPFSPIRVYYTAVP